MSFDREAANLKKKISLKKSTILLPCVARPERLQVCGVLLLVVPSPTAQQ